MLEKTQKDCDHICCNNGDGFEWHEPHMLKASECPACKELGENWDAFVTIFGADSD